MNNKEQRELSFIEDYSLEDGDFKEVSGLIKDGLCSWRLCSDNNTYVIESAYENKKHRQFIEMEEGGRIQVFDYHSVSQITRDGYYYGIFDCAKFDYVEQILDSDFFICRKNDLYGIIQSVDVDGKHGYIVWLEINYPLITQIPMEVFTDESQWFLPRHLQTPDIVDEESMLFIKVSCADYEYLYNPFMGVNSGSYDKIYTFGRNFLIVNHGLYGLLSREGEEILPPKYRKAYPICDCVRCDAMEESMEVFDLEQMGAYVEVAFDGKKVPISNNGKYYGYVSTDYDECIEMRDFDGTNYRVKKDGKYGLLGRGLRGAFTLIPTEYNSITFDENHPFYSTSICFAIVQDDDGYQLYNIKGEAVVGGHHQSLEFTYNRGRNTDFRSYAPFIIAKKNDRYALLSQKGVPLTDFIFQSMLPMTFSVFPVCKDDKWGIIDEWGKQIVECEWDAIENISTGRATLMKDSTPIEIELNNRQDNSGQRRVSTYERKTYTNYHGSYAQDEMGYSDDDIDTIFDGDPSAYWNID